MRRDQTEHFKPTDSDTLWYKDAVIYQVHVKSFFDSNGDGIGDFAGLIAKLDYIAMLGVNTIWLLPFYPSPRRDDGYDIAEYRDVHPDYGTLADARHFIAEAHRRKLRVITELVINHTSDQHPWFVRARAAKPGSAARNYYVWSDTDQTYAGTRIIFCDTEKSNWTWDPQANAFYWHRFYSHQPDLNFDNPQVVKAVLGVMRFWLNLGVDGLRLDAIPYLVQREGTSNENLPETHAILKILRAELDRLYTGRVLLAEANMWPEDVQPYFGGDPENRATPGDECHMAFHFPLMPRMFMALAQEDRFPITDILRQTPEIPANCQWAIFLRNHDELTLEMVTDKERDYLWNYYASDSRARINLGIRRRLAPLVERDRRRVELLNTLLLSMPGTPVLYYGDEIGMGDNIHLGDRDGVRTPMQWSPDRNGGFSRADPASLVLPPIMDALYGYEAVNVEAQSADRHSLLNWLRRMLEVRSQHRAFGHGTLRLLYPNNRKVLAYLREYSHADTAAGEMLLCVANVSRTSQAVELDLSSFAGRLPVEMIGGATFPAIGQLPYLLTLQPYGFYWFVLSIDQTVSGHRKPLPGLNPEFTTLVLRNGAADLLQQPTRGILERDTLPAYLPTRRWYAATQEPDVQVRIDVAFELGGTERPMLLTEIVASTAQGSHRYVLPLGFLAEHEAGSALPEQLALARVRRGRRVGLLTDAFALPDFVWRSIELLRENAELPCNDGVVRFTAHGLLQHSEVYHGLDRQAEIRYLSVEQSNSSVVIGNLAILKLIRQCQPGIHPEAEMGHYLTEAGYANIAPLLGSVTRFDAQGTPHVLAVLQGFIHNQGDAWQWALDALNRDSVSLAEPSLAAPGAPDAGSGCSADTLLAEALAEYERWAANLGQRLGEMHLTLAQPTDNPAFTPYPASRADTDAWARAAQQQIDLAFDALQALPQHAEHYRGDELAWAAQLQTVRAELLAKAAALARAGQGAWCTRIHGDMHLGQVLIAQGDAFFVDFEGEPSKPLPQRRQRGSALRDVAGILRSFSYVAAVAAHAGPGDLTEAAQVRRDRLLAQFLPHVRHAFLDAYWSATRDIPQRYAQAADAHALLDLFTLEKAAYEVCYENAHRPGWVGVPLRGLLAITERLLKPGSRDDA